MSVKSLIPPRVTPALFHCMLIQRQFFEETVGLSSTRFEFFTWLWEWLFYKGKTSAKRGFGGGKMKLYS